MLHFHQVQSWKLHTSRIPSDPNLFPVARKLILFRNYVFFFNFLVEDFHFNNRLRIKRGPRVSFRGLVTKILKFYPCFSSFISTGQNVEWSLSKSQELQVFQVSGLPDPRSSCCSLLWPVSTMKVWICDLQATNNSQIVPKKQNFTRPSKFCWQVVLETRSGASGSLAGSQSKKDPARAEVAESNQTWFATIQLIFLDLAQ